MGDLERVEREMRHYLDNRLESFSNGSPYAAPSPADKTDGYLAAKVPDWCLRQWIARIGPACVQACADQDQHIFEWFNDLYPDEMAKCLTAARATPPAEPQGEE